MASSQGLLKKQELLKAQIDAAVRDSKWLEAHKLEQELGLLTEATHHISCYLFTRNISV